eukprot:208003-Pleurochrysis_carterae.AAC.2
MPPNIMGARRSDAGSLTCSLSFGRKGGIVRMMRTSLSSKLQTGEKMLQHIIMVENSERGFLTIPAFRTTKKH